MASIAFVAAARIGFAAMRDPEDDSRHLFLHAKNNISRSAPGLAYRIEGAWVTSTLIETSRVVWEAGCVSTTAAEVMAASHAKETKPALEEAKEFLKAIIGSEGKLVEEIETDAKEARISWATIRRPKDELKLKSVRDGFGGPWKWKWG